MNHVYKGKRNNISGWLPPLLLLLLSANSYASDFNFHNCLTTDTIPVKNFPANTTDTIPVLQKSSDLLKKDTTRKDTITTPRIDTFSFKTSSEALSAPVTYHADDSMVVDVPKKKMYLYGKISNLKYIDNDLSAPLIEYDQSTNLVKAVLIKDSTGKVIAFPSFNQADFKSTSDTIVFNFKTQKGITKGTYTQQGEMYVYGEKIKKVSADIFYALRGRFTTCNLDTPHFAFVSSRIKFINQKMAFTGPVHPEFEGVPIPVYLPFGIYPLKQGRHSGLIAPSFTANEQTGLALEGIGYYKILSDYWDIVARGTIHSYGGWMASITPRYYRRYRYQGNFSVNMQNFKTNFKGDPDYQSTKTVLFQWSHNADTKARPGVNFNATVNAGSSKYNQSIPNSPIRNFTNQMSSSITYAKVWKDRPYNLSVSANHNQNTQQRLINLNLPDIAFNVNTQYPFRRKEPIGQLKWYENIGVALNSNVRSLSSFYDTAGRIGAQLIDNLQYGASHTVPISISLPQIGPVQVSPSVSYQEKWYQQKFTRSWNSSNKKVDTTITKGFYTAREMTFGISATTRIFGMYTFGKGSRLKALRHEIRPSVAINYKPDFNKKNYYTTQVDTSGFTSRFSSFERSIYGPFSEGKFGGLSFAIDNILSMKVKDKKDTSEAAVKKVMLIDGLGLTGSYNFLADSFQLSGLALTARSNLFDKVNITGNAFFDPYLINERGQRIDKLIWSKRPLSLGRLTSGNIALQSAFRGGDKSTKKNNNVNTPQNVDASGFPLNEYQQEAAYIRENPGEFADFSIPWSIDFSYSLRFQRDLKPDYSGFVSRFFQDVNWNGSVNLTPKWKIGVTGSYNITDADLGLISMYLSREMHCWQMNINISPVGRYRFFSVNISPKSGLLRDLKINRTRSFYDL
ncbi:MAG: putative LPS assembly protein LptD [Ferruginibacter sp.]